MIHCKSCRKEKEAEAFTDAKGKQMKTCNPCREKGRKKAIRNRCIHGRYNKICKDCGTGHCEHGRNKNICKDCGTGHCEHGRYKTQCKECGTFQCEHGKEKARCKDCGTGHCEHGKRRDKCRECGTGHCEHGRDKHKCRECGTGHCEHGRRTHMCVDCEGSSFCEHGCRRSRCVVCDPTGHLIETVRSRVKSALKGKKEMKTVEYLGCTIEEFKVHIEAQFVEGMTWETHGNGDGKWNIDHITPIKYCNPTIEEVVERLHWTNTQPMWALENIAKGNRLIG